MKKTVTNKSLHNLMTLAADRKDGFFNHSLQYRGLYCLFSVAVVKEEITGLSLGKDQVVLASPMIDNQENHDCCTIYRSIDLDAESGLLIPYISWALEFTRQILSLDIAVDLEMNHRLMERILQQVWEYEEVRQSAAGLHIDLHYPRTWASRLDRRIRWDDCDTLDDAETLLKSGVIRTEELVLPHVHIENIDCFRSAGVKGEVIFDW